VSREPGAPRISLEQVNKGFELMHDKDGIRTVIELA